MYWPDPLYRPWRCTACTSPTLVPALEMHSMYRSDPLYRPWRCTACTSPTPCTGLGDAQHVPAQPLVPALEMHSMYWPNPLYRPWRCTACTGPTLSYAGSFSTLMAQQDFLQYLAYHRPKVVMQGKLISVRLVSEKVKSIKF